MQQGLPSDRVRAVLQTRDGYLWVATFNGAAQFDGVRFRVFNDANTPALRNSLISCLFEDAEGRLWLGSDTGEITWRDEAGFHALAVTNNWPSSPIDRLRRSADGTFWVLSRDGFILCVRNLRAQGVLGEAGGAALLGHRSGPARAGLGGAVWRGPDAAGKGQGRAARTCPGPPRELSHDRGGAAGRSLGAGREPVAALATGKMGRGSGRAFVGAAASGGAV